MAPKVLQPQQPLPTGMPHLPTHRAPTVQLDLVWVQLIPTLRNLGIPSMVDWNQMPSYARPYLFWQRFCIGVDFSPGCNLIWTTFCGSWRVFWDFLSIMFCHNLENNYPGSVSHILSWRVGNMDNLRWVVFIILILLQLNSKKIRLSNEFFFLVKYLQKDKSNWKFWPRLQHSYFCERLVNFSLIYRIWKAVKYWSKISQCQWSVNRAK